MGFLGQHFPWVVIVEGGHFTHGEKAFGFGNDVAEVFGGQNIVGIGIARFSQIEARLDIQFAGGSEGAMDLELSDGAAATLGEMAVDGAAGKV